ncbi:MAG: chemotaxis response regulator protein-glutamate methylesterase [Azonexus sp.]|jgi:two-component system chemotaxis response regulator CheB|nr:chemotaxis response regulator protein-glutamate methylesterase [Azonexus sp.]
MANKTRVLIIDDSAAVRMMLSTLINAEPDLTVVGLAEDALMAQEMIRLLHPDVLTLDVEMPKMDGLAFLQRLMSLRPMPVVMVSTYTEAGTEKALLALELGAVDVIGKLRANGNRKEYAQALTEKIRAARYARLRPRKPFVSAPVKMPPVAARSSERGGGRVIFIGASTGGTEALKELLAGFPADCPPTLIVQHMPETFTASFARRLDSLCLPRVIEAQGGERLENGTVYLAPGHSHLQVRSGPAGYLTGLLRAEPVNRHRPAVDVLFDSAATVVGRQAIGVILTGMGKDGAQGLLKMRQAGAQTFGQDEASCVVYGMPQEAFRIGAVDEQRPLGELAQRVLRVASGETATVKKSG